MEYLHRDGYLLIRRRLKNGYSSFSFIPKMQYLTIRKGVSGRTAIYLFPTTNELYRNTRQISYPKGE
jgi:hypothetical protein